MKTSPPVRTIVLASHNEKKCRELLALLQPLGFDVQGMGNFPEVPDVVEDRDTFTGNAEKKATEVARQVQQWTLAEDSGLVVPALKGAPGVYSARYAHLDADDPPPAETRAEQDQLNNTKLIAALDGVPPEKRTAYYVCTVAVSDPAGTMQCLVEGRCYGRILEEPRGKNGFGYDPYFLIREYHQTFGELSGLVKNQISHRARALRKLLPLLHGLS